MYINTTFITCKGSPISTEFAFKAIMDEIARFLREKGDFLSASEIKRIVNSTSRPYCTQFEGNLIIIYKSEIDITDSKKRNNIAEKTKALLQNMLDKGYFTYADLYFSSE